MDYNEWAEEYREEALRVLGVIEKKKALLNEKKLTADSRKQLNDVIIAYRRIYRELVKTAEHLSGRAQRIRP